MESTPVPPPAPATPNGTPSSVTDTGLALAHTVLDGLTSAAKVASAVGIPFIAPAAEIALRLVSLAEQYRINDEGCKGLIQDACHVVYVAYLQCNEKYEKYIANKSDPKFKEAKGPIDANYSDKLFRLLQTLENIETQCKIICDRKAWLRFFASSKTTNELAKLRSQLNFAMQIFGFHSSLEIQDLLETISQKLADPHLLQPAQYLTTNLNVKTNSIVNIGSARNCGNSYTYYGTPQTHFYTGPGMNGWGGNPTTARAHGAPVVGHSPSST